VTWGGFATQDPVFGGGLVARSLASRSTSFHATVGTIAAAQIRPAERRVLVLAWVGNRLVGSSVVQVFDSDGTGVFAPGARMRIEDWRLCSEVRDRAAPARPCGAS